jgi:hypothetical protein
MASLFKTWDEFHEICRTGNLTLAKWYNPFESLPIDERIHGSLLAAMGNGYLEMAKWIYTYMTRESIDELLPDAFIYACSDGYLDVAQWLLEIDPDLEISHLNDTAFKLACANGHAHIVQWLLELDPSIDESPPDSEYAFRLACTTHPEHFKICQMIYQNEYQHYFITTSKDDPVSANYLDAFEYYCSVGDISSVHELLQKYPSIFTEESRLDFVFHRICKNGQTEMAKWLRHMIPTMDISTRYTKTTLNRQVDFSDKKGYLHMKLSCVHGNLEMAKWLYTQRLDISVSEWRFMFSNVCQAGHLDVVKWLLQIKPSIGLITEHAFCNACYSGNLELAQYLLDEKTKGIVVTMKSLEEILLFCCRKGLWEMAQFVYDLEPTSFQIKFRHIDVSPNPLFNHFFVATTLGNLETARWIYSTFPAVVRADSFFNDVLFPRVCEWNLFDTAKWLLQVFPSIDILSSDGKAFRMACARGNVELAQWLQGFHPFQFMLKLAFVNDEGSANGNDAGNDAGLANASVSQKIVEYWYSATINYAAIRDRMDSVPIGADISLREALIRDRFHPRNESKWIGWDQMDPDALN